jgi:hypothetical protein
VVSAGEFDSGTRPESSTELSTSDFSEVAKVGEFGDLVVSPGSSFLGSVSTSFDFEALFAGEPEDVESFPESSLWLSISFDSACGLDC